ncbi:MAG TPA: thiamine-binding protein [Kribbella sp.]
MRLVAEFTTEPFDVDEGSPPAHATEALRAAQDAGLECDFGPLGTLVRGEQDLLLPAIPAVLKAAFAGGASQVTLQVRRDA